MKILQDVGAFMHKYGSSIYDTRGGIVPPQPWGVTTQKGKKLYIHILNQEKDGKISNEGLERIDGALSLMMPKGKYSVKSITRMDTGAQVSFRNEAEGTRVFLHSRPTTDQTDLVLVAQIN